MSTLFPELYFPMASDSSEMADSDYDFDDPKVGGPGKDPNQEGTRRRQKKERRSVSTKPPPLKMCQGFGSRCLHDHIAKASNYQSPTHVYDQANAIWETSIPQVRHKWGGALDYFIRVSAFRCI